VVHESIVRSFVKMIVCNNRISPLKLKAEPVNILLVQLSVRTLDCDDGEVEELYDILEILGRGGKR
jgi:hypothetical protein